MLSLISFLRVVALGFTSKWSIRKNVLPGWKDVNEYTWGYHADDGRKWDPSIDQVTGEAYADPYGRGDTIGCGVDFKRGIIYYTRNGKRLRKYPGFVITRNNANWSSWLKRMPSRMLAVDCTLSWVWAKLHQRSEQTLEETLRLHSSINLWICLCGKVFGARIDCRSTLLQQYNTKSTRINIASLALSTSIT